MIRCHSARRHERENGMKKYLITVAFILGAPQSLLAQADAFLVILDNTTNACRVVAKNDLPASRRLDTYSWANTPRRMRPIML